MCRSDILSLMLAPTNSNFPDPGHSPALQKEPMKNFDARFRIVLALLMALGILALCFELWLFLWQDRFTDRFSRLDLILAPLCLAAGLGIGTVTGRWRFQTLKELAHQLPGTTLFREKNVLSRSELGQRALNWENGSYAVLFYVFLGVWGITGAYFMPVGAASFFVLGLWLAGQTVPYFRLWLWQNSSRSQAISADPDENAFSPTQTINGRGYEPSSDQGDTRPKKRFDPRLRIVLTFGALIPCFSIGWSLWKERQLGTSGLLGLALILMGLAVGMALGEVIGRWRFRTLQEVSTQLAGRILFREPNVFSRSDSGKKVITTEKVVIGVAGLSSIVRGDLSHSFFLPIDVLVYFLLGLLLTSQAAPYTRFWLNHRKNTS